MEDRQIYETLYIEKNDRDRGREGGEGGVRRREGEGGCNGVRGGGGEGGEGGREGSVCQLDRVT